MKVAEEDIDLGRDVGPEIGAERRETRARIDDEEALAAADLDARRMTAEFNELRSRSAIGAPRSPEADLESV
jgi:hypothetical protein